MQVLTISVEKENPLQVQKKFQNKSKNIGEVYQSEFFRCIMFLSYRITFLCNVFLSNSLYIRKFCTIFFYEKSCKVVYYVDTVGKMQRRYKNIFKISYTGRLIYAYSHYNMCAGCGYMYQIKQLSNGNVVLVCPMLYYSYQQLMSIELKRQLNMEYDTDTLQ